MDKNLPKVFASPINKNLNNNLEYYVSSNNNRSNKSEVNINKKINEIFASPNHVYKSNVKIVLENDTIKTTIVGKNNMEILTLDGKHIPIKDILDIEKI